MRKLGLLSTLLSALLLLPLSSFALGLGEIEVNSFLNQPLKAEIEVVSARPGEIDDLLVSLASRDAFRKAGLERPSDLSKLRFKVEKSEDGQSAKILVTTKAAIKEPFLNFLVEADWAKGRLLREFTVLLDPPSFAQQAVPAPQVVAEQPEPVTTTAQAEPIATQSTVATESMPMTQTQPSEPEPVSQPIALAEEPTTTEPEIPFVADTAYLEGQTEQEIVVAKGDTLWGIASQFKDDEHSMAQIMLALQATNPDAFGQDNINNLKVGAVLRAPDMDALDSLSKQQAYAQVLEQNGLWDDYVARTSGVTTTGTPVDSEVASSAETEDSGQLSLLAPGEGDSTTAGMQQDTSGEDNASQLRKQLALAEEDLEAARLENDDLKSRISALEEQISKFEELQKLVQIEDDSLAQLQDSTAQEVEQVEEPATTGMIDEQPAADEAPMGEEQPSEVMIEAADAIMSEQAEQQQMTEEAEVPAESMMEEAAPEEQPVTTEEEMEGPVEETETMVAEQAPVTEEETATPAPAPVIVTETPATALDGGIMDMLPSLSDILADPVMLGGIGAIIALLLGLLFLKLKKSSDEEEGGITLEEPEEMVDEDATPIHVPTSEEAEVEEDEDAVKLDDTSLMETEQHEAEELAEAEEEGEFERTAVISAEEMPEPEAPAAEEQDDVLNEVDVYLAYGLYDNAEELLKESIENHPERADYRAKMLDTYFATKNKNAFVKEAEALKTLGSAADRYWDRVQIMGFELAPDNELFAAAKDSDLSVADLEYAKPEAADFDIGAEEDITDFSNTDFDLGADDTFEMPQTQVVAPAGGDDFSETQALEDEDIQLPDLDEMAGQEEETSQPQDDDMVELEDLPDEIGEVDLSLGEQAEQLAEDLENIDEDSLDFDLPDGLDLSVDADAEKEDESEASLIELEDTVQAPESDEVPPMDEEEIEDVELDLGELETKQEVEEQAENAEEVGATQVMTPVSPDEGTTHIDAALDLDMSQMDDADLQTGTFSPVEEESAAEEPVVNEDITEFRPADMTGEFEAIDEPELDEVSLDVDTDANVDKTGTFAPGDFNDDEELGGENDIEGLMLPDDVDEVSTKLDLAKAFIDMGDAEGARGSLEEVLAEGTQEQKAEATGLLNQIK